MPLENVDEFRDRPINAVTGLLPDANPVLDALSDTADVGVLHSGEGTRIIDRSGSEHGVGARFVRLFQNFGYTGTVRDLYLAGLSAGETLVVIPAQAEQRHELAQLLLEHGAHGVHWFGPGTAEQLSAS